MANNNVYNEDELNAPDWLNDEFFIKVLQNCENALDVKVIEFLILCYFIASEFSKNFLF